MSEPQPPFLKLMTKADVAEVFGVCTKTVDAYVRSGLLPMPKTFGAREYWHPELFAQFLREAFGAQAASTSAQTQPAGTDDHTQPPPSRLGKPASHPRRAHPVERQRQRQEELLRSLNTAT